jgi:hypothetical protein
MGGILLAPPKGEARRSRPKLGAPVGSSLIMPRGRSAVVGGEGRDEAWRPHPPLRCQSAAKRCGSPLKFIASAPTAGASSSSSPASPSSWGSSTSAPHRLYHPLCRHRCTHKVSEGGQPPHRVKEGCEGRGRRGERERRGKGSSLTVLMDRGEGAASPHHGGG